MSGDIRVLALFVSIPVVLSWILALLPKRAGVLLAIVAIAVSLYVFWINATDKLNIDHMDLGPYLWSVTALAALAGLLMALIFHLIGRRSWRWRLACFAAGFPLGYSLIGLYMSIGPSWFRAF